PCCCWRPRQQPVKNGNFYSAIFFIRDKILLARTPNNGPSRFLPNSNSKIIFTQIQPDLFIVSFYIYTRVNQLTTALGNLHIK
ncbi:MAG TPA: hypothetical protein VGW31_06915, partial [Hanamia sp.]|nr:hypothetical protein [Hanamia sp.]